MQDTKHFLSVLAILIALLCCGCASDRPPAGGVADTSPLRVMLSSPAPSELNVSSDRILLTFNHYFTGRQLIRALAFSPAVGRFDVSVDGKKAEIRFLEPLQKNRTYTLTIDNNLKDFRGRSFSEPFSIAFSTGPSIESGTLDGNVYNSDYSPAVNALVLAYAAGSGRAPGPALLKTGADHVVWTGPSGAFSFRNLAPGPYRVFAVNDRNRDMRYNGPHEEIGLAASAHFPDGSSGITLMLGTEMPPEPLPAAPLPEESGTMTGTCAAAAPTVIVTAREPGARAAYRTRAIRDRNGLFRFTFTGLPPGRYTVMAYIPSGEKTSDLRRPRYPGSIEPWTPAEPFAVYPAPAVVRARWTTEHIDLVISK
jgi:hypothetical protein